MTTLTSQVIGGISGAAIGATYKYLKTGSWAMAGRAALDGAAFGIITGTAAGLGAGLFALGTAAAGAGAGVGYAAFGISTGIPMLGLSIRNIRDAYSHGDNVDKVFAWGGLVLSLAILGLASYSAASFMSAEDAVGGTAIVTQHPGTETIPVHFSVEVITDDGSVHTHLTPLNDGNGTIITTTDTVDPGSVRAQSEPIELSNAGAAQKLQNSLVNGGNQGPYDKILNSCTTHVCDVLNAGGLDGVPAPGNIFTQARFILRLIKG